MNAPHYRAVLLAKNDVADAFKKYAPANGVAFISAYDGSADNHAAAIESVPNAVVVMDITSAPASAADELIRKLQPKRGYIAIVGDIREGFVYLGRGAADMIVKPAAVTAQSAESFVYSLCTKIKMIKNQGAEVLKRELKYDGAGISDKIIAIGSSTGGTEIILEIIKQFPHNCPPVLVAQHMPPVFTKLYAQRLHDKCKASVWEAKDGDALRPGLVLIAPGDHQMRVVKKNGAYSVTVISGEKVNGHAPSIDVLFNSVAQAAGSKAIGVILTGMGMDGASGLLEMRKKGAATFGQDAESSVVYGMPKAAFEMGAVMRQLGTADIPSAILKSI